MPQGDHTTAPAEVDTLRGEQVCPVCGSDMDKETCDVCGFVEPPKGFDNPDLEKAQVRNEALEEGAGEETIPQGQESPSGAEEEGSQGEVSTPTAGKPGSFLQAEKARKAQPTASVMSDMRWEPKLHSKVAGRINQTERPIRPVSKPVSNEPSETVTSDQLKPVTAAFRTAQDMIQAAKRNNTGENMSTQHVADAASGAPEAASPDKRVDVTGVGGIIEDSNDAASHADAQVSVTGTGGTGVEGVEADSHESLPTADPKSDDAGFNHDKTTDGSGKTKTWGDGSSKVEKGTSPVTTQTPYWVDESKWSSMSDHEKRAAYERLAYDSKPFPDDSISGGSAKSGTEPVDPVGKADERVDLLKPATSPDNNSGSTSQWTGTDGNGVTKQQPPVTKEVTKSDGINSHFINAMKLADAEVEMGLLSSQEKYARIAQLETWDADVVQASLTTLSRVKTAGLTKQARTAHRLPSFKQYTAASDAVEPQPIDDGVLDSALFTR